MAKNGYVKWPTLLGVIVACFGGMAWIVTTTLGSHVAIEGHPATVMRVEALQRSMVDVRESLAVIKTTQERNGTLLKEIQAEIKSIK